MKFSVTREALLEPLQVVTGVVERRQTLPILSNLLVEIEGGGMTLTGTDQEVQLATLVGDFPGGDPDAVTIPARKLLDICRSLPRVAEIEFVRGNGRIDISSGQFRSHLATLDANEFPKVDMGAETGRFSVAGGDLSRLVEKCSFAMAQQDVRYFFNGMLLEIEPARVRAVATNGQRLATSFIDADTGVTSMQQVIIPRKGVLELARVALAESGEVALHFSRNHLRVNTGFATLTTKLIDATYPDYSRAIPAAGDRILVGDRREIKEALGRTAILSNEMYRNVRLRLSAGKLQVHANNPLQEEAEESVAVDYDGAELEIGFNVGYMIDVLGVMEGDSFRIQFTDGSSAALFTDLGDPRSQFVISPMML